MSEHNGETRSALREARAQRRLAEERRDLARLQVETRLLEGYGGYGGYTGDGWGASVDPSDAYRDPDFRGGAGGGVLPGRRDLFAASNPGVLWPVIKNEVDADELRGATRVLVEVNDLAAGVVRRLRNFTVKTGFKYQFQPHPHLGEADAQAAAEVAAQLQRRHDAWRAAVAFDGVRRISWAEREREACVRRVRDGEWFLRRFVTDRRVGTVEWRWAEPEQIRRPPVYTPEYSWGVLTGPDDVEKVLAYWQEFDGDTAEGDVVPADEMVHCKGNVDQTIKRGLSDFYCTRRGFDGVARLREALTICARIRGGIAWIEQFASARQAAALAGAQAGQNARQPPTDPLTGRAPHRTTMEPGVRLMVGQGREFVPVPTDAGASIHVAIGQYDLRCVGARWDMPEFMISGDASNNNYASILVAGSPFVTAIECEQDDLKPHFAAVHWGVVRAWADAGLLHAGGRTLEFADVLRLVDLHCTPPSPAIANRQVDAEVDHKDLAAGVMSLQTRREKIGLDNDKERQNLKEEPAQKPPQPGPGQPPGQGPPQPRPGGMGPGGGRPSFFRPRQVDEARATRAAARLLETQAAARALRESKDASGHEHGADGRFGSGGGSGKGKEGAKPRQGAADGGFTPPRELPAKNIYQGADAVQSKHALNMRVLMQRMAKGEYSPADAASEVERHTGEALAANNKAWAGRFNRWADNAAHYYPPEALASPEFEAVKQAFRAGRDRAAEHLQGSADNVRAVAEHHAKRGTKPEVRASSDDYQNIGRERSAAMDSGVRSQQAIYDALDRLDKKYPRTKKQTGKHLY